MKSVESVRRIDGLGRIVIPKDIRNNLKIKQDDLLSFFIDNDSIVLKKYSLFENFARSSQNMIDSIHSIYNCQCLICDTNSIISSSNKSIIGKKIADDLLNYILKRKEMVISADINVSLNYFVKGYNYLYPIMLNGDSIGLLLITNFENTIEINKLGKLVSSFLSKEL